MELREALAQARKSNPQRRTKQSRAEIEEEAKKAVRGLSPRDIESKKLENADKTKEIMSLWSVYKNPSFKKKFASVEELRELIHGFLSVWDNANLEEVEPPTLEELACHLGYATVRGMMVAIKTNSDNEIGELLSYAVEQVKSIITMKMMAIASVKGDYKAFAYLLDNINDNIRAIALEGIEQNMSKTDSEKARLAREADLRSSNAIDEAIAKFTEGAIDDGVDSVVEIEFEEDETVSDDDVSYGDEFFG